MKRLIIFSAIIVWVSTIFAQTPEKISYQAVVRDASSKLVTSQSIGMQISFLQGSPNGKAVYVERHFPTTNSNGLVSIEIGDGTMVSGNFSTIDWVNGPYFIKTETDLNGGANYTIFGTSQLLSVPFALHAKTADSISGTIPETDPVYSTSVSSSITTTDITNWNNKLDKFTETDSVFSASPSGGITTTDITNWNKKLDSSSMIWTRNGNTISYSNGNIGIGTNNPIRLLHLVDTLNTLTNKVTQRIDVISVSNVDSAFGAFNARISGTNGNNRAVEGISYGVNSHVNIGMIGFAQNAVENRAIYGTSQFDNSNGLNYGVTAVARESVVSNVAVGAYAENGSTSTGDNYGVSTRASSTTTGANVGIYSEASNGGTNYAGYFNGDVTVTGTLSNPSDAKLKSNIQSLNNATAIIKQLKPVEYEYKHDFKGLNLPENHQYGFIAQDLELVLPELVSKQKLNLSTTGGGSFGDKTISTNEDNDTDVIEYKGINYISLIPIMVQSMKEQDKRIEELENLIFEMQNEIDILKAK